MRPYEPTDLAEINGWYRARGLPHLEPWALPFHGFIETGVAAGFLYSTDSGFAFLDGFISNPGASPIRRARVVAKIVKMLTLDAGRIGFHRVLGIARNDTLGRLVERQGMTAIGKRAMYVKEV